MKHHFRLVLACALFVLALNLFDAPSPEVAPVEAATSSDYHVTTVIDGDTIHLLHDGTVTPVRLIGIDSPELDTPYTKAECYGAESSIAARELMQGRSVRIETDPTQDTFDAYGRLLAYVYVDHDGTELFVNKHLVETGNAREYTFQTAYQHQAAFRLAEQAAERAKHGLWACE